METINNTRATTAQGWAAINRQPQPITHRAYAWACRNADNISATLALAIMAACAVGVTIINGGF